MTWYDLGIILAYTTGIMLIFMLSWIFIKPFKTIVKIILNSVLGAIIIFIFNSFSSITGILIGINVATALVIGALGVPGFITLLILKLIL